MCEIDRMPWSYISVRSCLKEASPRFDATVVHALEVCMIEEEIPVSSRNVTTPGGLLLMLLCMPPSTAIACPSAQRSHAQMYEMYTLTDYGQLSNQPNASRFTVTCSPKLR